MTKRINLADITNLIALAIFSFFVLCSLAAQAAPVQIYERQVLIGKENALHGVITVPVVVEKKVPCVVLVHGVGRNDRNNTVGPNRPFMEIAHKLAAEGIAVIRYDKRTFAYPACTLNPEFGIEEETINDAVEAVEVARAQDEIDPDQVFVAGHSMGGVVVSRVVARDSRIAGAIILCSPGRKVQDIAKSHMSSAAASAMVAKSWEQLKDIEAPSEIVRAGKKVFVAQGTTDEIVTACDGIKPWTEAVETDSNDCLSLAMYPGMNHFMLQLPNDGVSFVCPGQVNEQLVSDLSGWLKRVVNEQSPALVSKL